MACGLDVGIPATFMRACVRDVGKAFLAHFVDDAFLAGGIRRHEGCGWVHVVKVEANLLQDVCNSPHVIAGGQPLLVDFFDYPGPYSAVGQVTVV